MLFITNELGAWLVRNLFSSEAPDLGGGGALRNPENTLRRLAGIIFLGADDERAPFEYSEYLEKRLTGSLNQPQVVQHRTFLTQSMQLIDKDFVNKLVKKYIGLVSATWILPPLALSPPVQVRFQSSSHNQSS